MKNKLFRVITPSEWGMIVDARLKKKVEAAVAGDSPITIKPKYIDLQGCEFPVSAVNVHGPCVKDVDWTEPRELDTHTRFFSVEQDYDFEHKSHHGAYADDDREEAENE